MQYSVLCPDFTDIEMPDGFIIDASGTYALRGDVRQRLTSCSVWVSAVKMDAGTLDEEITVSYMHGAEIIRIPVGKDTFNSFERTRERLLRKTDIDVEAWMMGLFLRYLRASECKCLNSIVVIQEAISCVRS